MTLRQAAIVQSTESSNRIEGVVALPKRLQQLLADKTTPQNRSEQEILGYRDVLATIHASAPAMPFTPGVVQQLHRDLFHYSAQPGGTWKAADNAIEEIRPDGTAYVRFQPVPIHLAPIAMQTLHQVFGSQWQAGETDHLMLIPASILDFLCFILFGMVQPPGTPAEQTAATSADFITGCAPTQTRKAQAHSFPKANTQKRIQQKKACTKIEQSCAGLGRGLWKTRC